MATLHHYAAERFPEHRIEVRPPDMTMTKYTTVVEVKGAATATEIANRLRLSIGGARIGLAFVVPNPPTVVATTREDTETSIDLPRRRLAIVGVIGALVLGGIGLFVARQIIGNWAGTAIAAAFLAVIGVVIAVLLGGGGRYAGKRAWEQQRQGDATIGLVAVCLDDEAAAQRAAAVLEEMGLNDVRIVGENGAWHLPNT